MEICRKSLNQTFDTVSTFYRFCRNHQAVALHYYHQLITVPRNHIGAGLLYFKKSVTYVKICLKEKTFLTQISTSYHLPTGSLSSAQPFQFLKKGPLGNLLFF